MILKLILLALVIWAVYYFFFKKKSVAPQSESAKPKPKTNEMVECASCGTFCDIDEALLSSGKYYCSQECMQKA